MQSIVEHIEAATKTASKLEVSPDVEKLCKNLEVTLRLAKRIQSEEVPAAEPEPEKKAPAKTAKAAPAKAEPKKETPTPSAQESEGPAEPDEEFMTMDFGPLKGVDLVALCKKYGIEGFKGKKVSEVKEILSNFRDEQREKKGKSVFTISEKTKLARSKDLMNGVFYTSSQTTGKVFGKLRESRDSSSVYALNEEDRKFLKSKNFDYCDITPEIRKEVKGISFVSEETIPQTTTSETQVLTEQDFSKIWSFVLKNKIKNLTDAELFDGLEIDPEILMTFCDDPEKYKTQYQKVCLKLAK